MAMAQTTQKNNLPEGWKYISVNELESKGFILEIRPGFASGKHNQEGIGVLHLRPMNINTLGEIDLTKSKFVDSIDKKEDYKLMKGDVIFNNTNSRELVGKTAIFLDNVDCYFSNHMTRIRVDGSLLNPSYLSRYLHLLWMKGYFNAISHSHVSQASVSMKKLGSVKIPVPPINIQEKIVKKLDSFFEYYNKLKDEKLKAKEMCGKILQSAFDQLVPKKTNLPENWNYKPLSELASIRKEKIDPKKERIENYIGLEHIKPDKGSIIGYEKTSDVKSIKNKFKKGDILYGRLRPYLNKVFLSDFDGSCSTDILPIVVGDEVRPHYLFYIMLSSNFVTYAHHNSKGIQLPRISFKDLGKFGIIYPDVTTQVKIVDKIKRVMGFRDSIERYQVTLQKQLDLLPKAVLAKAFRGELV